MRVLLDTNFLIDLMRFKVNLDGIVDLVGSAELFILSSVQKELTRVSSKSSKAGIYAKAALELVEEREVGILESNELPDKAMLKLADDKTIIATNDAELRKRLKALGRKTIYLKSKKHLAIS